MGLKRKDKESGDSGEEQNERREMTETPYRQRDGRGNLSIRSRYRSTNKYEMEGKE